jgi:hypothetical protein
MNKLRHVRDDCYELEASSLEDYQRVKRLVTTDFSSFCWPTWDETKRTIMFGMALCGIPRLKATVAYEFVPAPDPH